MARSSSRLLVQIILASEIGCPQQKPGGFLRSRSRCQQCAIILAQNGEPGTDIGGMIVEMGGWETHIGANQRCEAPRLFRRLQLVRRSIRYEQDDQQIFT